MPSTFWPVICQWKMCIRDSSNIGHLQRIAVQMHVTSVRAGRCLHAVSYTHLVRAGIGIITCVTLVDSQGLCGTLLAQ